LKLRDDRRQRTIGGVVYRILAIRSLETMLQPLERPKRFVRTIDSIVRFSAEGIEREG
jgi:hypothetical protein